MSMDAQDWQAHAAFDADRAEARRAELREAQAEINNDIQGLMAAAEEIALKWARNGWLDQWARKSEWDDDVRRYVLRRVEQSDLQASAQVAGCIQDVMRDAMSDSFKRELEDAQ